MITSASTGGIFELNESTSSTEDQIGSEIISLIQTYGPIIRFHTSEQYFPDDPEVVLENSTLVWGLVENPNDYYDFTLTTLGSVETSAQTLNDDVQEYVKTDSNFDDPLFRYWLDLDLDNSIHGDIDRAKAYIRVCSWGESYFDIQFWIFYPFNGAGAFRIETYDGLHLIRYDDEHIRLKQYGRHEGDWEVITLRFSKDEKALVSIGLSQHGDTEWFNPNQLQYDDSHPIIYSAYNSHAMYEKADSHYYEITSKRFFIVTLDISPEDVTQNDGVELKTFQPGNYKICSSGIAGFEIIEPSWLKYEGRWGGGIPNYEVAYTYAGYEYVEKEHGWGPSGPNRKPEWPSSSVTIIPIKTDSGFKLEAEPKGYYVNWVIPLTIVAPIFSGNTFTLTFDDYLIENAIYMWKKWDGSSWVDIDIQMQKPSMSFNFLDEIGVILGYHGPFIEELGFNTLGTPGLGSKILDGNYFDEGDLIKVICTPIEASRKEPYPYEWIVGEPLEDTFSVSFEEIPVADFSWSPSYGVENYPVYFTDKSLSNNTIASWNWDFGDQQSSLEQNPIHTYNSDGYYNVYLEVIDIYGNSGTITHSINVFMCRTQHPRTHAR